MKLTELEPLWIPLGGHQRAGFVFRCPHCTEAWIVVKRIEAWIKEQGLVLKERGFDKRIVLFAPPGSIHQWTGEFADLTVFPEVAAHVYIRITKGEVTWREA